jgi:hypothetical protein
LLNVSPGQINATRNFSIADQALLQNQAGAVFSLTATNSVTDSNSTPGGFLNEGTFLSASPSLHFLPWIVTNAGLFEIRQGPLRIKRQFFQGAGELRLAGGQLELDTDNIDNLPPLLLNGGVLAGFGSILHTNDQFTGRTITNRATIIKPGLPLGVLTLGERYEQGAAAALEIELAGLNPGAQHDQLVVLGSARLGGTLRLQLRDGFVPAIGDEFVILTCASRSGASEFDAVEGQEIGGGKRLEVVYVFDRVVVRCVASP